MLKAALNHAFDEGQSATATPGAVSSSRSSDVEAARVRYLTIAEAERLINASDKDFRPLVRAGLETGCRYGELTRLEVQDFNPDAARSLFASQRTASPGMSP